MTQPTWIGHNLGGRYLIEGELGQGGMSAVYKATDSNLRRVVAVKLIHGHLSSDPEFVRRFEAEATVVAQLRHPNIVQVYDYNHEGNTYFIVFEFVPGETLQARMKRLNETGRQMSMDEVLKIANQIAEALSYAHERDIVHRDIKPANVMLNVHGDAILTDFGIVKIIGGTQHTATGAVLGTARYMSPEQIKGQRVDWRTDIYSFGVMLYEMVGGRPPFNSDSAMTLMMMHVSEPVPDVRSIRAEVPPGLVRIINRALSKEPERRYSSVGQMSADLKQLQDGAEPIYSTESAEEKSRSMLDQDLTELIEADEEYVQPVRTRTPTQRRPQRSRMPATPQVPTKQRGGQRNIIIGGVALIAVAIVAIFLIFNFLGDGGDGDQATRAVAVVESPEATQVPVVTADETATPEATEESEPTNVPPSATPAPSDTPPPTATVAATDTPPPPTATSVSTDTPPPPTPTSPPPPTATSPPPPTATSPPVTAQSVQITDISISNGRYVVNYQTFGYTETLPGMHIHFFFDTVPPSEAGVPGSGPWILYGGPRPFTGYTPNDRGAANRMCALVANPDHSVIANSGNCVALP